MATRQWVLAAIAGAGVWCASGVALASEISDACMDLARSSPVMKSAPGDKGKWCDCIAGKFAPADQAAAAAVIKLHRDAEVKGEAFSPDRLPPAQSKIGGQYFDAVGTCLPIMMGAAPPAATPAAPPAAPPPSATPVQKFTGVEAWSRIVNNTVTATIAGKEHTEYYMADGTVKSLEDSELSTGKWSFEGTRVCFIFPKEDKECFTVELAGDDVSFTDKTGAGLRVRLLKGNPKNL